MDIAIPKQIKEIKQKKKKQLKIRIQLKLSLKK